MDEKRVCFNIADVSITLTARLNKKEFNIPAPYAYFSCPTHLIRKPDIVLQVCFGIKPEYELGESLFEDKRIGCRFYRHEKGYIFKTPERLMFLESDFSSGFVYVDEPCAIIFRHYPIQHPLDKLLMLNLLSVRRGAMVHACGVKYNGNGLLFAGTSGAGKSTLAKLWLKDKEKELDINKVVLLNDDRVIVRNIKKDFYLYGTPWHGEVAVYSPEKAPLKAVFFLSHAKTNRLKKLSPREGVLRLLSYSLAAFWEKHNMEASLGLYADLAKKVPFYELGFVPDNSVVDFIKAKL